MLRRPPAAAIDQFQALHPIERMEASPDRLRRDHSPDGLNVVFVVKAIHGAQSECRPVAFGAILSRSPVHAAILEQCPSGSSHAAVD
jgi:hypothetical protein